MYQGYYLLQTHWPISFIVPTTQINMVTAICLLYISLYVPNPLSTAKQYKYIFMLLEEDMKLLSIHL
jgi:hypothetical protein